MQHTVVKPPRTAAAAPVSSVSFSGKPGSRKWTCTSIKPGVTTRPLASTTSAPAGAARPTPTAAICSPTTNTSATASSPCDGSTTRPPRIRIGRPPRCPCTSYEKSLWVRPEPKGLERSTSDGRKPSNCSADWRNLTVPCVRTTPPVLNPAKYTPPHPPGQAQALPACHPARHLHQREALHVSRVPRVIGLNLHEGTTVAARARGSPPG